MSFAFTYTRRNYIKKIDFQQHFNNYRHIDLTHDNEN